MMNSSLKKIEEVHDHHMVIDAEEEKSSIMALDSRRMQTFFNEFLITTTSFLNQFASECEGKFFDLERKLYKIESNLVIIEQKLASVPSEEISLPKNLPDVEVLKQAETTKEPEAPAIIPNVQIPVQAAVLQQQPEVKSSMEPEESSTEDVNMIKISESAIYRKYFKMLKVGIPAPAVKQKMSSEGLDASLLDNPELMIEKSEEDNEEQ